MQPVWKSLQWFFKGGLEFEGEQGGLMGGLVEMKEKGEIIYNTIISKTL